MTKGRRVRQRKSVSFVNTHVCCLHKTSNQRQAERTNPIMEDILDKKSRQFQRKGWNGNGSRMLAAACLVSERNGTRFKRNLVEKDILGISVIVCLVLKYSTNSILLLLIAALSISYAMKKLLKVYDLHSILNTLDGSREKLLVLKLMDFCEAEEIDPESLADIGHHLEDTPTCDQILKISCEFINSETSFYVMTK